MIDSTVLIVALAGQALIIGFILFITRRNTAPPQTGGTDTVVGARLDGLDRTMQTHFQAMTAQGEQQRQALDAMRREHEQRLEAMRQTVDEKLTHTLNSRITESFASVSERLEAVHRGLGDMQQLAAGVGDLKKVMTNVRVRGTWGEYQLSALLEQFLTEPQFERNFRPRPDSREVVEFAIRFPGRNGDGTPVYLPVDSKFPIEDFARLVEASETGDQDAVRVARAALVAAVKKSARDISEKYLVPPVTTDFGVLFLPTESLYAEVVREVGLVEDLQQSYRIHLAGPTTLGALLTSFRVGFQSIVIEQRAGEIEVLLGLAKREFGKFNEVLDKAERQIDTVARSLKEGRRRTKAVERKLREVETLDEAASIQMLGAVVDPGDDEEDTADPAEF
ncbi:MAG: DNA recombination protein RmuC [Gemmatimonadota bacterium]|jgi:DNA recombination protein RmuC|nr:DNA recombination protein RmuC [Gemmatimonadota bacterium]MDQ8175530.1 DNA recombination protein RmuC [Gemmatimonadota bacterium]